MTNPSAPMTGTIRNRQRHGVAACSMGCCTEFGRSDKTRERRFTKRKERRTWKAETNQYLR